MKFLNRGICLVVVWPIFNSILPLHAKQVTGLPSEPSVIEELLQMDTQAALLAARKNIVGPLNHEGPVVSLASHNLLVAIYGVGQTLTAEVLLDAESHIFKNRRSQPVIGRSAHYTLERIEPPCIYLKKNEQPEVLCLGQVSP